MTSRQHHSSWSIVTVLALGAGASAFMLEHRAHAEEDSATETGAARTLAVDGLKLAQAGKCDEAAPKLERAEKLHHSAIVLSRLGECNVSLGKLVEGSEQLRKVLREPLPANPTPALSKAYEHAQAALDSARPRIGGLTVSLGGAAPQGTRLTVDGKEVPATLVDTELPADPGDHTIEASAPGYLKASAHVSLGNADKKTVSLKLDADPNAPAPTPEAAPAVAGANSAPANGDETPAAQSSANANAATSSPPAPHESPNHAAAYVAWGMGVVGVGVGSAFGLIAMKDKHDLTSRCGSNACGADSSSSLDSAKRAGNISTIAFGVGGAGLVLGTVLFFTVGNPSERAGSAEPAKRFAGLTHGRAMIGPGSVQLAADF